jgi:hypothetical protein
MRPGRHRRRAAETAGGIALIVNHSLLAQVKFFLGAVPDTARLIQGLTLAYAIHSKEPTPSGGIEQRKSPRKKVLLTGKIIQDGGAIVFDCTIRDISATGARITLNQARAMPETFYLLDMVNRVAYEATTVSERAGGFGLKFKKTLRLSEVNQPELRYLKRIWLEYAR